MSSTCASPIAWERLVDYWANDLDGAKTDRVDEHLMACDVCSVACARVAAVREAVRQEIPPFVSHVRVEALRARGLRIVENPTVKGERVPVTFGANVDILLHRLGGLDLRGVDRVSVKVIQEATGEVVLDEPHVPFDAGTGEILVACQRHFGAYSRTIVFEVRAHETSGAEQIARYAIPHVFEAAR